MSKNSAAASSLVQTSAPLPEGATTSPRPSPPSDGGEGVGSASAAVAVAPVPPVRKGRTTLCIAELAAFAVEAVGQFTSGMSMAERAPGPATTLQVAAAVDGINYRLTNPGASPEAQHASWVRARKEAGWKFGKVRDEKELTHPNLCEFKKLPAIEQARLKLFTGVVDALKGLIANDDDPQLRGS